MTDAERCAEIARRRARTFALAASLLLRDKRRGVFALYAFCRQADDMVDTGTDDAPAMLRALASHRASLHAAFQGRADAPVFRELQWAIATFGIPRRPFSSLLDGVASDVVPARYATWTALDEYCTKVASSVGEMCTYVFGTIEGGRTLREALIRARALGRAMQLTNILRDVGEDAARGRCYLPAEDLARFGFTADDVLTDPEIASRAHWRELMRFEIDRARALYAEAETGIALLAGDARQCAAACARGYAAILTAIERQSYDTITTRAVVPSWRKARVLWQAWRLRTA